MKKILIGIICILVIALLILSYQSNEIRFGFKILTNKLFTVSEPQEYNSVYKVNDLSISTCDYYFCTLNEFQKILYTDIIHSIKNYENEVVISEYDKINYNEISENVKYVMNTIFLDHPEIYYVKPEYSIYVSNTSLINGIVIKLNYNLENRDDMLRANKEINNKIDNILKEIDTNKKFDTELQLHDYVAKNFKYHSYVDEKNIEQKYHTITGPLLSDEGVCDGLSKTLQVLLNKVGIESIFVTGLLDNVSHGWLMVKLDNKWYNLDVTSNKYIINEIGESEFVSHTYFNVTTNELKKTHKFDNEDILPLANSLDKNYYVLNKFSLNKEDNMELKLKEIINKQKNNKYIEFVTDYSENISNKLLMSLYNINFNNYKSKGNSVKLNYYKEGNTYTFKNE